MEKHQVIKPLSLRNTPASKFLNYVCVGIACVSIVTMGIMNYCFGDYIRKRSKIGDYIDDPEIRFRRGIMSQFPMTELKTAEITRKALLQQVENNLDDDTLLPPQGF